MGEEFKPSLHGLGQFDGKIKADYNEFTQYLTLVLANNGKMGSFNGIVKDQSEVDTVVVTLRNLVDPVEEVETEEVEEPKKLKKK